LLAATGSPAALRAQQAGSVTGTVTNRQTGQPLAGAQVFLQNTRFGQVTDANGRFSMTGVLPGNYTLVAQFLGYAEMRQPNVRVSPGQSINVPLSLETAALAIQQLVVTGVSDPTSGVKLPFTVSKVTAEQLQVPAAGSALTALSGKVAGASVLRTSGQPGQGVSILLRTATASEGVTANDPLIVVDGVILARSVSSADSTGRTTFDADIDPADIESIEVVKGAAAASIYGSRAAAGVIRITTRRGRSVPLGTTRINVRSELGKDFVGGEFPLSDHHHYRLSADGAQFVDANGAPVSWSNRTSDPARRIADRVYPGTIYDNVSALYRPSQFAQQNVSLTQNGANTTFLVALNRLDQNGALASTRGYWRNQGRINLDHRIGDKFSIDLTALHSRSWQHDFSGNPYTTGLTFPRFVDLAARDGNGQYLQQPDSSVAVENPLFVVQTRDNFNLRSRTQGSAGLRFSPMNWLTLHTQVSYDRADGDDQNYTPKGVPTSVTQDIPSQGVLNLRSQRTDAYNAEVAATALRQFGLLGTRATVRASLEREYSEILEAEGRDFVVDGVRSLDAASTLQDIESFSQDIRANAFMVNLGADYKERYVLDGLVRREGSSLFGPQNRWQTYYRGALSYRISQEPWFSLPHVNELVLRYSIGTAGGRPTFNQQYELWNVSRTGGLSRGTAGNAQLKPHYTREQEFGITSILFDSRLSVELVYATQLSRDQIIGLPVPTISGFNSIIGNAGGIKGHTYEATINARLASGNSWALNVTAVADRSRNEITNWGRACFFGHTIDSALSNHEYSCDGQSRGDFWGARFLHGSSDLPAWLQANAAEFQVNDEGYLVWVGAGNTYQDGLAKNLWGTSMTSNGITYRWGEPILDVDEFGVARFHKLGTSIPGLNFGLTPDLRYKGFSIYAELRGQLGGHVYNNAKQRLYNELIHADLDQSGKPDGLKKTIDYYQRGLYSSNRFSEAFIESGTYLKIGALSARYRFSNAQLGRVLGNAAPQSLSLGATARNLHTFTGYTGLDPESGRALSRVETLGYPQLRTLTFTVDITF
jgi:TonB-linked SusC/RagA family outer membrane protein